MYTHRARTFLPVLTVLCFAIFAKPVTAQTFAPVPAMSFIKPFGGANPLPQILTIASVGTGFNFGVAVSTSTGGSWLSVSPAGCCYPTPQVITVVVNAGAALAAATYSGQVVVTSSGGTVVMTIPVSFTVATGVPFFDNLPGSVSFSSKPTIRVLRVRIYRSETAGRGH